MNLSPYRRSLKIASSSSCNLDSREPTCFSFLIVLGDHKDAVVRGIVDSQVAD